MRIGDERRGFWAEIRSKVPGRAIVGVSKKKKSRKDGRREESSLTGNGVMKGGGQEACDEPPGRRRRAAAEPLNPAVIWTAPARILQK